MEEYLQPHILDLARKASKTGKSLSSEFLGVSEQGRISSLLKGSSIEGSPYLLFGGHPDSERNLIVFFPNEEAKNLFSEEEKAQELFLRCLRITPAYAKESKELGHRDYLGALMSLGIKRETIGDILHEGTLCYLYLLPLAAEEALESLDSVGRIPVSVKEVPLSECKLAMKKEEMRLSVSSLRLDNIVSAILHLSREEAKNLILGERVHLSLHQNAKPDTILMENERVSVEGKGKFRFLEEIGTSKKGKSVILLERFV
ncbi:MAG: hypothetical protein J5736_03705 [Bacilli bacterium]|nr:hypothetical protein [Bacilli bacterium]